VAQGNKAHGFLINLGIDEKFQPTNEIVATLKKDKSNELNEKASVPFL